MLGTQHHVRNQLCLFVICEQAVEKRTSEPLLYSLCLPVSICESAVQHPLYQVSNDVLWKTVLS